MTHGCHGLVLAVSNASITKINSKNGRKQELVEKLKIRANGIAVISKIFTNTLTNKR